MEKTVNRIIAIILLLIGALSVGVCKDATFFLFAVAAAIVTVF